MIKILIIFTTHFGMDGITNNVMNYYRHMDKRDLSIDFVVPNIMAENLRNEIEKNNSNIYELINRNSNPIAYLYKLIKIIKINNYDIVHAHGNSCTLEVEMLAAKLAGTKIRIAHSRNTSCTHKVIDKILRPFFDLTYTHGFACGVDAGKWLFKDKPFTIITNGNDIEKFSYKDDIRLKYRKKYNLNDKKVIGHVGGFNYQKNQEFLIDIFKEVLEKDKKYFLILIGDGPERGRIEEKVKDFKLNDKVMFIGNSTEVNNLLQMMDVMVLPSRFEGLPNVVVEWQIAGLPSIISDKVTKDVKLTELVEFMPLEAGAEKWAEKIINTKIGNRSKDREKIEKEIKEAGFDIRENSKNLKKLYESFLKA